MYIAQWTDTNIGNNNEDLTGSDTALNLGYSYNFNNSDAAYDDIGLIPPAVGYDFLQGVSSYTGNPNDSAMFDLKWRKGYKYCNPKPMSSFIYFGVEDTWVDPEFSYTGTLQFYNIMRGVLPRPEYPSAIPFPSILGDITPHGTYLLDGDPVTKTGIYDGLYNGPGPRRIVVVSGPIVDFRVGDTAQVVIALVGGFGSSHLNSVTQLKSNVIAAQKAFNNLFKDIATDIKESNVSVLKNFELSQNYPNPFNPNTIIKFSIPTKQLITLKVYDTLGKEVADLVNKTMNEGNYKVNFDASQLSTGIYIYQMTAGNFVNSKKMILLK